YIAAIEAEVVRYAGLPEKLPEPAEPTGSEAVKEKAEPEALDESNAFRPPDGGN
ncbi:MAG: hypothetical protein HOE85_01880, partial [Nitrospinaceae bacterium]|nr:hypothetical protein [Nitrospinaceae bacterium]